MRKRENPLVAQFMDLLEEQGYRDTLPRRRNTLPLRHCGSNFRGWAELPFTAR